MKPQDNYILPTISSLIQTKLTDIEELFVYNFLYNLNVGPLAHFYVSQEKPTCLLIATADGNSLKDEIFYTAADSPKEKLALITIEDIVLIRIIEVIFCLKDLLSNEQNFGWLHPSKRLLIIDFSINKETMQTSSITPIRMLTDRMAENGRLETSKHKANFVKLSLQEKKSIARRAIELLPGSFIEAINPTHKSINNFICSNSYAFEGGIETTNSKLDKIVERTRSRWNELITEIKK